MMELEDILGVGELWKTREINMSEQKKIYVKRDKTKLVEFVIWDECRWEPVECEPTPSNTECEKVKQND